MSTMREFVFTKRFFLALAVACAIATVGVVIMKLADLPDAWAWAVLLISGFAGTLVDREGFYGTPPRERH